MADAKIQSLCTSWRQALRRTWKLSYNCHTSILRILSGCMPVIDVLCKRFYNFVRTCVNSTNEVVNFVTRQSISFSGMQSRIGRNIQFLCERSGM